MPQARVWPSIETMARRKQERKEISEAELKLRPKNIKNIKDLKTTPYPASVDPPDPELNFLIGQGRFRYHRNFLLQFMNTCTERPVSLVPLDCIGLDPRQVGPGRFGKRLDGRHANAMSADGALSPRQATSFVVQSGPGLSRPGFSMGSQTPYFSPADSRSRFDAPNAAKPNGLPSAGGGAIEALHTRSQRRRDPGDNPRASGFQPTNLEPIAPLERSENRWIARSTQQMPQHSEERQLVDRKVRALLNKLTMEKFDLISDQILGWANDSEQEDGATLKQVIELILEEAKEDTVFSEAYAQLCYKMGKQVSPNVCDKAVRTSEGQLIAGGALFRIYLVNRCQEDFERMWRTESITPAPFPLKPGEDKVAGVGPEGKSKCAACFDEYYAMAKTKRRRLGLVRFVGELCKLQVLTERIAHECIKKLLANINSPKEEEIEGLCKLLVTVGQNLDNPKGRNHLDIYFERMQERVKGSNTSSRIQFMLLDLIELRERRWQPRHTLPRSTPLHQASPHNDSGRRTVTRGGARRGGHRGNATEPDGWNVASGAGTSRPSTRAGDLSQFGKISKPTGIQFGPSSVFSKKDPSKHDSGISRPGGANMFSAMGSGVAGGPSPRALPGLGASSAAAHTSGRNKRSFLPKTKQEKDGVH